MKEKAYYVARDVKMIKRLRAFTRLVKLAGVCGTVLVCAVIGADALRLLKSA